MRFSNTGVAEAIMRFETMQSLVDGLLVALEGLRVFRVSWLCSFNAYID